MKHLSSCVIYLMKQGKIMRILILLLALLTATSAFSQSRNTFGVSQNIKSDDRGGYNIYIPANMQIRIYHVQDSYSNTKGWTWHTALYIDGNPAEGLMLQSTKKSFNYYVRKTSYGRTINLRIANRNANYGFDKFSYRGGSLIYDGFKLDYDISRHTRRFSGSTYVLRE